MQSATGFNPFDASVSSSRGGGGFKATSGAMGIAALFTALLSSNASGSFKIVAYGLLLELARRAISWLYARFAIEPKVSATFTQGDPAYEWIMLFLTEEGVWKKSKDFDVSVKSSNRKFAVAPIYDEQGVQFSADLVPKWSMPHLFRWNRYWIDVTRGVEGTTPNPWSGNQASPTLTLRFLTLDPVVIARFVEFCKKRYEETNRPRVTVHLSDTPMGRNVWSNTKSKVRRPINTVTLPSGVMDSILEDVREFMDIEDWYITAGIPHHRGYLLHGPPGTGKTSTIYAVAGELGLEIYALSLSASHIDDAYLHRLAAAVPRGSILLIEDIDCAFPSRDADEDEAAVPVTMQQVMQATATGGRNAMVATATGRVTMSGLLNLMDGVGSDDGRIIFATTNYYDRLDPALVRPGRIDIKVQYHRATTKQAGALFDRFFPSERFISPGLSVKSTGDQPVKSTVATSTNGHKRLRTTPLNQPLTELSKSFASGIPPDEFSAAELQGYLLTCKWDPEAAVAGLGSWIEQQRIERKERAAREVHDREKRKAKREAAEDKAAERIFSRVGGRRGGKMDEE